MTRALSDVSNRAAFCLVMLGLLVSIAANLIVSSSLARTMSGEFRRREMQIVFGAIEAGPLVVARLNSASLSQEALNSLMSTKNLNDSGLVRASIMGGENQNDSFAKWTSDRLPEDTRCIEAVGRSYLFKDAIYPFRVEVSQNSCFVPTEVANIRRYSLVAGLIQTLLVAFVFAVSTLPIARSISAADNFISKKIGNIEKIPLKSIRALVQKMDHVSELEKQAALSNLATQVAHDIRAPLSVLNLLTSLDTKSSESSELIKSAAARISAIAADLLRSTRKSVESAPISEIGAKSSIDAVMAEVTAAASETLNIRFSCDYDQTNPALKLDSISFQRTFTNLLNNAVESMESASGIISVHATSEGDVYRVSISDLGVGFPIEFMEKIGIRGFTFGKVNGNGLELWAAKRNLENVGGSLSIASNLPRGTTVTIKIPILI